MNSSLSNKIAQIKNNVLKENPNMTSFQKMVLEFYFDAWELSANDPQWVKRIEEMAEKLRKERSQFKSPSASACEKSEYSVTLELRNP